jgi:AraC-like DNA-binding protein
VWRSNENFYDPRSKAKSESITIHFKSDFLGDTFMALPECRRIKSLLRKASAGMQLMGDLREHVSQLMISMSKQSPTERLLTLLQILNMLGNSKKLKLLSGAAMLEAYGDHSDGRISKVHQYIITNFRRGIRLEEIADVANLSATAFCRFFKQRTKKSFSEFLIHTKINYACQLLQEKEMSISQVCYESGYTNLSNFNKQFKRVMQLTPQSYRNNFRGT